MEEIKKQLKEIQEAAKKEAKKEFGLFLDDISEINPLVKKLIDKSRTKWKV